MPDDRPDDEEDGEQEELVLEGTLVCELTGEHRKDTPEERTLQSLAEQLHREYAVAFEDMERDVKVKCEGEDVKTGKVKNEAKTASLVVYEPGAEHLPENIIRVAVVAKAATKPNAKTGVALLERILGGLSEKHDRVFGLWTNGGNLAFRMRTINKRTGSEFTELTDFPAPHESLEDLEHGDRRPLRIAAGDSLLRAFKRCHDYLYGNQNMRGDRAFWQLLFLIFAKILDEQQSKRLFFVGATEANTQKGQKAIAERIGQLFEQAKTKEFKDVFEGNEKIELNDRALAYIAGELGRYSFLSSDTDAKGMAYEAITSTTLKRERGQFFTPRNVIRMMVEMADPKATDKILDPACGSGGFLVVALAHVRRNYLAQIGCPDPDAPMPSELKKTEKALREYAKKCLYGIDVDPDLRKAARMNMVMNNDGHGNIFAFNSLEFDVPELPQPEWTTFQKKGGGHGQLSVLTRFEGPVRTLFAGLLQLGGPSERGFLRHGLGRNRASPAWSSRRAHRASAPGPGIPRRVASPQRPTPFPRFGDVVTCASRPSSQARRRRRGRAFHRALAGPGRHRRRGVRRKGS